MLDKKLLIRTVVMLTLAASLPAGLAACGGNAKSGQEAVPASPVATTAEDAAHSKAVELFTANKCVSCHGVNLEGKVGPETNLQKIGSTMTREQIIAKINKGGNGMPVFKNKLSEEEVGLLADWLLTKK